VPIQLTKHGELTDLEASKDFAVLNTTCYVLEVWNRPTDRREACNAYGQRGHCSNEGDNSKQDVCYDDFVYLFAYDNPSGNQSKVDINRTKITQTSVNCNQDGYTQKDNHNPPPVGGMKPGMPGYNKCDRQGGWYKMKAANKSVYATTQTWSTALSRGQVHRRGTGICAGAEFDAVRVPNATKAMFGEPPISFWAGDAVPCWMPLTEHATSKHYSCASSYNSNCMKLFSPYDELEQASDDNSSALTIGIGLLCGGSAGMLCLFAIFCGAECMQALGKLFGNTRPTPRLSNTITRQRSRRAGVAASSPGRTLGRAASAVRNQVVVQGVPAARPGADTTLVEGTVVQGTVVAHA